jgi:exodeoxyribonuclease VII large subunit
VDESMLESLENSGLTPRIWQVGALCRAVADALQARFNPVAVQGEISGFTRASSGHCYFTLKDEQGQLRCAMFKRAAQMLDFQPRDGDQVTLQGRLGVYEPRGELQLIVESLRRAGQGALFEQFLRIKAKLEAQGLFAPERKRAIPTRPRHIGVVTSLGAAALHDVATALQRRVPHIAVTIAPASVQGAQAPASLVQALEQLARQPQIDVILLVRGGGAMEDLWAFNDEQLAHAIVASPIPIICGVGHETDFTIADFCADLRAPTPTAAAELGATPQAQLLGQLADLLENMQDAVHSLVDRQWQRLDRAQSRLGRPTQGLANEKIKLMRQHQRMQTLLEQSVQRDKHRLSVLQSSLSRHAQQMPQTARERLARAQLRLELLDPRLVLQRGFAWLTNAQGQTIASVTQLDVGQPVQATLADGRVDLQVQSKMDN